MNEIVSEVFTSPGYSLRATLLDEELATLRTLITENWLERLADKYPALVSQFERAGIENYHELSHLVDHNSLWPKEHRIFNAKRAAQFIQSCSLFKKFKAWFGDYYVTDVENLGHEEFNWRLVRPNSPTDVGPLHADVWFYDVYGQNTPKGKELVKVWIPVYNQAGLGGLRVIPDSHHMTFPYGVTEVAGRKRPVITIDESKYDIVKLPSAPGDAVIFNYHFVHGGIPSIGTKCRVSIELTLAVNAGLMS